MLSTALMNNLPQWIFAIFTPFKYVLSNVLVKAHATTRIDYENTHGMI